MVRVAPEQIRQLPPFPERHLALAARAILPEPAELEANKLIRRLERFGGEGDGLGAAFAKAMRPDRLRLALIANCEPASSRKWLGFPVWLLSRAGNFLASLTRR